MFKYVDGKCVIKNYPQIGWPYTRIEVVPIVGTTHYQCTYIERHHFNPNYEDYAKMPKMLPTAVYCAGPTIVKVRYKSSDDGIYDWDGFWPSWKKHQEVDPNFWYQPNYLCPKHAKVMFSKYLIPPTPLEKAAQAYWNALSMEEAWHNAIGRTYEWWKLSTGHTTHNVDSLIYDESRLGPATHVYIDYRNNLDASIADLSDGWRKARITRKRLYTRWRNMENKAKGVKKNVKTEKA